ncbi:MAG TPA: DUF6800 family protein [Candidatus Methylomirabilis sp.]|nr:DUF6800 family protein [Candidatus Methylomirabilis sp.]
MPVPRKTEIHRRRVRRLKLARLRRRYVRAKSEEEKARIWQKVVKVNPALTLEEFLAPTRPRAEAAGAPGPGVTAAPRAGSPPGTADRQRKEP